MLIDDDDDDDDDDDIFNKVKFDLQNNKITKLPICKSKIKNIKINYNKE